MAKLILLKIRERMENRWQVEPDLGGGGGGGTKGEKSFDKKGKGAH